MAGPCCGPGPAAVGGAPERPRRSAPVGSWSSGPDVGSEVSFICIYLPHRHRFEARRQERRTTSRLPFDASGLRTPSTLYMKIVNSPGPGPIGPECEPDSGPHGARGRPTVLVHSVRPVPGGGRVGPKSTPGSPLRRDADRPAWRPTSAKDVHRPGPLDGPSPGHPGETCRPETNCNHWLLSGTGLPILGPDGRRIRASDTGAARDTGPVGPASLAGVESGRPPSTRPWSGHPGPWRPAGRSADGGVAAIGHHRDAGDVAGLIGQEEPHHRPDILHRVAQVAHGVVAEHPLGHGGVGRHRHGDGR